MAGNVPSGYGITWQNTTTVPPREYVCGFCEMSVAPEKGWIAVSTYDGNYAATVLICHNCKKPTFIDERDRQFPGSSFGAPVEGIDNQSLLGLYDEARHAMAGSCYTAAVLCCRKILMHIAVEKGAKPGESFVKYVEHLASSNYIPPDAKIWVDHIRSKANEANHEVVLMNRVDAEELISFTEMLLKVIYEFPSAIRKKVKQ